jgi:hypothetical protein
MMQTQYKTEAQSTTYVHPEDKKKFSAVCAAANYDLQELELVRGAYLRDVESGKITYAALYDEIRGDRFAYIAEGINERIQAAL